MDRQVLQAALRVLLSVHGGRHLVAADVELIRAHALSGEKDLELDDLAYAIANRLLRERSA
jgi:hypothetical protein